MSDSEPSLFRLPDELLLTVAVHLQASPVALTKFAGVCKQLRPIAEDVLYRNINVRGVGHFEPGVNRMTTLLRTLLDRQDLALKVDQLDLRTVRKNFATKYEDYNFDFARLREKCRAKLEDIGHPNGDPWYTMIEASIESAFAGLLLALVPNLSRLDLTVLDNHHGFVSFEPIVALYGSPKIVDAAVPTFRHIKDLSMPFMHLPILTEDLDSLTELTMDKIATTTISRLNGPRSLRGGTNVKKLKLEAVAQLMEVEHLETCYIAFADLLAAMGYPQLTLLDVHFWSEACMHGDPTFNAERFVQDLSSVATSLETLKFWLRYDCSHGDGEWILNHIGTPIDSLKHFTALTNLVIPDNFLFAGSQECSCVIELLPPNLEFLEVIYPTSATAEMLEQLAEAKEQNQFQALDLVSLTCCNDVNQPAEFFWSYQIPKLLEVDLLCVVTCHDENRLAPLGSSPDSDEDSDWEDEDEDESNDDDMDDLPDLDEVSESEPESMVEDMI